MSSRDTVRGHELVCPFCDTRWYEPVGMRAHLSCSGCGAGEGEMFRELVRVALEATKAAASLRVALTQATESAARFKANCDVLNRRLEAATEKKE